MAHCPLTAEPGFPHHYRCAYVAGHPEESCPGETCTGRCKSMECTLPDKTKRFPDGSGVVREHLQAGGLAVGIHGLRSNEFRILTYPKV